MDYKGFFALLQEVYKTGGIFSLIAMAIMFIVLVIFYEFVKTIIAKGNFPTFKKKIQLKDHVVFEKLDSIINYQIGNLKIACPLRNKIFKRILTLRFEVMKGLFEKETKRDLDITQEQLCIVWKTFMARLESEWCEKVLAIGLPQIIITRFYELRENINKAIDEIINNLCMRSGDVEETVSFIFDIIISLETSSLFTAGAAINSLNGALSTIEFEGMKCMKCNNGKCILKAVEHG